jgi:hypothetical protein
VSETLAGCGWCSILVSEYSMFLDCTLLALPFIEHPASSIENLPGKCNLQKLSCISI